MADAILTQDALRALVHYDPDTGLFTDRETGERRCRPARSGYAFVHIGRKSYAAHRLAFLYMDGALPSRAMQVNHIDHDPYNNRWGNLELVTPSGNAKAAQRFYRDNPGHRSPGSLYEEDRLDRLWAGLAGEDSPAPKPKKPKAKRDADITKPTHRAKLAPRREPYWRSLGKGRAVGVRVGANGQHWIARRRRADGPGYDHKALGNVVDYDTAERLARAWFAGDTAAAPDIAGATVADACRAYVATIRAEKGDHRADPIEARFQRRVYGHSIAKVRLAELSAPVVEGWRNGLLADITKASANRERVGLFAALNKAYRDGLLDSDKAWRNVKPFAVDLATRTTYLPVADRRRLIEAAPAPLANLLKALAFTAARPIELTRATVGDLDTRSKTLSLTGYKGRGGIRRRAFPLSADALAFFAGLATGRGADEPLLLDDRGEAWRYQDHNRQFRAVAESLGFELDVSMYSFRHAVQTDWLEAGINPVTVARVAGTSVRMIETHYAKTLASTGDRLGAVASF